MATASDHSLPAINELLSARSEVYLFVYIFIYINTSAVETPDYKRGCFAGYYFIAHSRKKVILLPFATDRNEAKRP